MSGPHGQGPRSAHHPARPAPHSQAPRPAHHPARPAPHGQAPRRGRPPPPPAGGPGHGGTGRRAARRTEILSRPVDVRRRTVLSAIRAENRPLSRRTLLPDGGRPTGHAIFLFCFWARGSTFVEAK